MNESTNEVLLFEEVESKIERVHTTSFDLSFNELLSMYNDDELIVDPAFQRLFRWSDGQQSRFIESLMLEMPIPPIFVIEREEKVYELIDGLQRISTYIRFRGALRATADSVHNDTSVQNLSGALTLTGCDLIPELNGYTYKTLPQTLKIKLKRSFIRVEVIRKGSDQKLRYYMFKRLNSGGSLLKDQEMRNATIRLLGEGEKFSSFLSKMANTPEFKTCVSSLSDNQQNEQYAEELVLRFFAYKNWLDHYEHNISEFLTEYMENVADCDNDTTFDYNKEESEFSKTFKLLAATLGEYAFSAKNDNGNFITGFRSLHYECFVLGIQSILDKIDVENVSEIEKIKPVLESLKSDPQLRDLTTGGGKNYPNKLRERINYIKDWLNTSLEHE